MGTSSTSCVQATRTSWQANLPSNFDLAVMEAVVWAPHPEEVSKAWYAPSDEFFATAQSTSKSEFANLAYCTDVPAGTEPHYEAFLSDRFGLVGEWTCESIVEEHCFHSNNSLLRHVCPERCGCSNPQSPLYLNGALFGCPQQLCRMREDYSVALDRVSCSTTDVVSHPNWSTFVSNMHAYKEDVGFLIPQQTEALLELGCAAVLLFRDDLCADRASASTIAVWCPVECGCRAPHASRDFPCPPSCDQWSARYAETLAALPCDDVPAADFQIGPSADFLQLHLSTFYPAFVTASAISAIESLVSAGCGNLTAEWCSMPMVLRALCPVFCGCVQDPHQVGCRPSCASEH